jgi:hypothetical protein
LTNAKKISKRVSLDPSSLTSESAHGENSDGIPSGLQDFCSPEKDQGDGNDVTNLEEYYASAENRVQRNSRTESYTLISMEREGPTHRSIQIQRSRQRQRLDSKQEPASHQRIPPFSRCRLTASLGCTRARCGDTGPYRPSRAVLITIRLATVISPCVAKAMATRGSASALLTWLT